VQGPESDSFGFAVTQAGPIAIDVQAQGAPLLVTLQSTGGRSITQPATGGLRMSYTVTPQDVQRTLFWYVEIRLAQPMPPFQGGRASGTVNVQHPPVNTTQVQAAVAAQQQVVQQQAAQLESQAKQMGPQTVAQMEQAFQQRKARFQQEQMARRSAMMAKIQPQVTQLQNRLGRQIRPRGIEGGDGPENTEEVGETTEEIGTRAIEIRGRPACASTLGTSSADDVRNSGNRRFTTGSWHSRIRTSASASHLQSKYHVAKRLRGTAWRSGHDQWIRFLERR
jgi:hypothetical protein